MATPALPSNWRTQCGVDSSGNSAIGWIRSHGGCRLTLLDAGGRRGVSQILVDECDRHAALAHGSCNAFDRPGANVPASEDSGHARLEEVGIAFKRPGSGEADVWSGEHVAASVERHLRRQPFGLGIGADEDEQPSRWEPDSFT